MDGKKKLIGKLIKIPDGCFQTTSLTAASEANDSHTIYLDSFYMDAVPITNLQFKEFIKKCPEWQKEAGIQTYRNTYYLYTWRQGLIFPKGKRDHPAIYMNWYAAAAYCNWRSHQDGLKPCYDDGYICDFKASGYRLPTEAEFEFAARGGMNTIYPWGDEINKTLANYDNHIGDTVEVASYPANGYGLYDMSGHIGHWCQDWYVENPYTSSEPIDNPRGPSMGEFKCYRGGGWGTPKEMHGITKRFWQRPTNVNPDFGFRCVRKA